MLKLRFLLAGLALTGLVGFFYLTFVSAACGGSIKTPGDATNPFDNKHNVGEKEDEEDDEDNLLSAYTVPAKKKPSSSGYTGGIRPVKLAYLILVHTPDSVRASQRLMTAIWRPDFYYIYVVDREMSDLGRRALAQYLASPDAAVFHARGNVRVMRANVRAGWGSMGLVQNELDGLAELVRAYDDWDYALAVSGDTYPLVSQERLVERLAYWRRRGANFVCDDGKKPERNQDVPPHKSARMAKVSWPTGVTEPDQFGTQVLFLLIIFN
jgi:hypothetical protein